MKTYDMQSLEYNQKTFRSEMQNEIGSFLPKLHNYFALILYNRSSQLNVKDTKDTLQEPPPKAYERRAGDYRGQSAPGPWLCRSP